MRLLATCTFLSISLVAARGALAQEAGLPDLPEVADPMLAPIQRAQVEIGSWEDALVHLRARSTDLRIALEDVRRAEAQSRVALAGALPAINGTVVFTHNIITNTTVQFVRSTGSPTGFSTRPVETPFPNFVNGNISLVQPVVALRAWYAIGTADKNEQVAALSLEDQKRVIALNVANAIVAAVTNERLSELNRIGLRNALTRLALTLRRNALGGATGLDVVRARQDTEAARATLVNGDEQLRRSREALGLALGIPGQIGVKPGVNLQELEASTLGTCKAKTDIEQRPDLAALRGRVEVAERLHNDVKYQFAPTVNLQSGMATTTIDTGAAPNTTWNVQGVLSVPIWDGGARYGNLRDTTAQRVQAENRLEAARRNAIVEVERARRGVAVAEDRLRVETARRDLAAESDRLTRTAYLEGRGTSLELVVTAQALREAEIQLALREFEAVQARVLAVLTLARCEY